MEAREGAAGVAATTAAAEDTSGNLRRDILTMRRYGSTLVGTALRLITQLHA